MGLLGDAINDVVKVVGNVPDVVGMSRCPSVDAVHADRGSQPLISQMIHLASTFQASLTMSLTLQTILSIL